MIARRKEGIAIALTCAASLAACGERTPMVRRYSSGDTVVVENARPRSRDTLVPVETARYGTVDGPVESILYHVAAFAVDDAGAVYVNDRSGGVRRFSPDGRFDRYLAHFGEGPEDVGYAVTMDAVGDGVVAVSDLKNRRYTVLKLDGTAWGVRMPDGWPVFHQGGIVLRVGGALWVGYNPQYPESGGIGHPRAVFLRASETGSYVDTLFTPGSAAAECPTLSSFQYRAGFWEDKREPFVPKVQWALGRDGTFVVGCNADYGFVVYRTALPPLRVQRAWTPVEVSNEERAFRSRFPVPRASATLPAYARIILPGDGRVWVWPRQPDIKDSIAPEVAQRFGVDHTWALPSHGVFDVFGREGDWLATVRLPVEARYSGYPTEPPVVIRGDTLWAVAHDSLDIETIVRYVVPGLSDLN